MTRPWLDAYPPGVPPSYRYPDVPVTRFLDDAARDFPGGTAVTFAGERTTYEQLLELVDRFAAALLDLGVRPGERVGIVLPNIPASVIAAFAAWRVGAVTVLLGPLEPAEELHRLLDDAGCAVAVCLDRNLDTIQAVHARLPELRHVLVTAVEDWLPRRGRLVGRLRALDPRQRSARRARDDDEVRSVAELIAAATPTAHQVPVAATDAAALQYTGGTTAARRAVVLTHGNLVANSFQARLWVPDVRAGRERLLAAVPFWHVYGLTLGMLTPVLSAATIILVPDFDVERVLATVQTERPTLFPGVPSMYEALVAHPRSATHDLGSIRACVSGAAPLAPETAARFETLTGGARVRQGYGLSEASPLTHANPIYGRAVPGTIGLPVTDTLAVVLDPDDPSRRLAPGQLGELAVRGPQVMAGYWNDPDATAAAIIDGWLLTGDLVTVDDAGWFTLVDRKADVIGDGPGRLYPSVVEAVLTRHPGVAQATVVGVPDASGHARAHAYVVPRSKVRLTAAELDTHARQHLPADAVPVGYELREALPATLAGKVLRRHLGSTAEVTE